MPTYQTRTLAERYGPPTLKVLGTMFAVAIVTFALLWNTLFSQMPQLPSKESLWTLNREPAVEFIDTNGQTIAVRGPRYGRAVSKATLPNHVVRAFMAAEDKNFLEHSGVDYGAIFRATMENLRAGHT